MNSENSKIRYIAPLIERIKLDNEISLALASTPPVGPDEENILSVPEFNKNNPFF